MLTIAYSGKSRPSALKMGEADYDNVQLIRNSSIPTDVNWGRYKANSTLNPDISNATNKRVMRELFKQHGVPMPHLLTRVDLIDWRDCRTDYPVIIGRPDQHTKGRGFWKIRTDADLDRALRGTRKKKAATHFMEFVESDREYRVHVFKGKSIRISEKKFDPDGSYTTAKPGNIKIRNVRDAAKQAVEAVGLDFGAVDVLAAGDNNEQVWVTEVNAAPGLGGSMPQLYTETFKKWKDGAWTEE